MYISSTNTEQPQLTQHDLQRIGFLRDNRQSDNVQNGRLPRNTASFTERTAEEWEWAGMKREIASMRQKINALDKANTGCLAVMENVLDLMMFLGQGDSPVDQLPPGV